MVSQHSYAYKNNAKLMQLLKEHLSKKALKIAAVRMGKKMGHMSETLIRENQADRNRNVPGDLWVSSKCEMENKGTKMTIHRNHVLISGEARMQRRSKRKKKNR